MGESQRECRVRVNNSNSKNNNNYKNNNSNAAAKSTQEEIFNNYEYTFTDAK